MVADYADEIRLEQGRERSGILYAMVTTTQKLGASINVLLVFPLLQLVFHFNPKIPVNDAFALTGLQLCYLFTPIIFVFVGGAMFFGYQLDEARHAEIRLGLEDRDRALAEAEAIEPAAQATAAPVAVGGGVSDFQLAPRRRGASHRRRLASRRGRTGLGRSPHFRPASSPVHKPARA